MIYGDEKVRTMARSVLPSTRRRTARYDKQSLKRRARRQVRQTLDDWKSYSDPLDCEAHVWDYYSEPRGWGHNNIHIIVGERQNGDKIAPMQRWAVAHTAHLADPEERYNMMKRALPDNLIGRHALSHLDYMDEFRHDNRFSRWTFYKGRPAPEVPDADAVRELVAFDLARVNRAVKRFNTGLNEKSQHRRALLCSGLGDEKFFERCSKTHTSEARIVRALLDGVSPDEKVVLGAFKVYKISLL